MKNLKGNNDGGPENEEQNPGGSDKGVKTSNQTPHREV